MTAFAYYRLPFADTYTKVTQTSGNPIVLKSIDELGCQQGFVIVPFAVSDDCPIVVINGESEELTVSKEDVKNPSLLTIPSSLNNYPFDIFHAPLLTEKFCKIVLARTAVEESAKEIPVKELFHRACALYPRLFVALVSTPQTGTWLVATPEILLDGSNETWRTMALAGTMKLEGEQLAFDNPPTGHRVASDSIRWSDKNISEQRYVASYINDCLKQYASDIEEDGPYTARAGNLVHLRSDFHFQLNDRQKLGSLLASLHPTPAVCGLPKEETFHFIIDNEPAPRRYYSGFMGPLNMTDTHLYVSLRCMEIKGRQYHLHAGGGLLKDSKKEQEWEETEAKMGTMRRVLSAR